MDGRQRNVFRQMADTLGRAGRFVIETISGTKRHQARERRGALSRMKWCFAFTDDTSSDYQKLIKVAVITAQQKTTLEPYCIYDGVPSDTTRWLERRGVHVIYHRSCLTEDIVRVFGKDVARGSRGAFLRVEIPNILTAQGIEDDYVLYTDCDVMFVDGVDDLRFLEPKQFACAPEFDPNDWSYVNTGVMLMNVKNLRRSYKEFISFIRTNMTKEWTWDQTAYNLYYSGKIAKLPIEYNWKPYWGDSPTKKILHFHGPKPVHREWLETTAPEVLLNLYNPHRETYHKMFRQWDEVFSQAGDVI